MTQSNIIEFAKDNPSLNKTELAKSLVQFGHYKNVESARTAVRRSLAAAPSKRSVTVTEAEPIEALAVTVPPVHAHSPLFTSDKKIGRVSWRKMVDLANTMKAVKTEGGWSQSHSTFHIPSQDKVGVVMLSDLHALSYGTDHTALVRVIDEIMAIPNLMIGLVGDLIQMSINLRSVQEVSDNMLPPEQQMDFLEDLLEEIKDRVLFCTWDNHSVEREEKLTGISVYKRLANRRFVYFNGIGHLDINIGSQTYKMAVTHKVRGRSLLNATHGQQRYMRFEGTDREIMVAGDSHRPGTAQYTDGDMTRLAVNCGALQITSGYAQRHFSLYTHPIFPIVTLRPDRHEFTADWTLKSWLERFPNIANN